MRRGNDGISPDALHKISKVVLVIGLVIAVVLIVATSVIAAYSSFITAPWDKDNTLDGSMVVILGTAVILIVLALTAIAFAGLRIAERTIRKNRDNFDFDDLLLSNGVDDEDLDDAL